MVFITAILVIYPGAEWQSETTEKQLQIQGFIMLHKAGLKKKV